MPTSPAPSEGPDLDSRLAKLLDAGKHGPATTLVLRSLGSEVLRFLVALHRGEDEAADVFSEFSEALWRALPSFERRCSVRTWVYAVARRTSLNHRRLARRRKARVNVATRSFMRPQEGRSVAGLRGLHVARWRSAPVNKDWRIGGEE